MSYGYVCFAFATQVTSYNFHVMCNEEKNDEEKEICGVTLVEKKEVEDEEEKGVEKMRVNMAYRMESVCMCCLRCAVAHTQNIFSLVHRLMFVDVISVLCSHR